MKEEVGALPRPVVGGKLKKLGISGTVHEVKYRLSWQVNLAETNTQLF